MIGPLRTDSIRDFHFGCPGYAPLYTEVFRVHRGLPRGPDLFVAHSSGGAAEAGRVSAAEAGPMWPAGRTDDRSSDPRLLDSCLNRLVNRHLQDVRAVGCLYGFVSSTATSRFPDLSGQHIARTRRQAASPARQRLTVTFLGYGHTVDLSSFPDASVPVPRQSPHQSVDPLDDWRQYVRLSLNGRGTTFPPCAPCVFDGPENSPYTSEPVHQPTTACAERNNTHTRRRASARHEPFLI